MGVSKNTGTPKWMVYNGSKPYCLMDDLGGFTTIFGNTQIEKNEAQNSEVSVSECQLFQNFSPLEVGRCCRSRGDPVGGGATSHGWSQGSHGMS